MENSKQTTIKIEYNPYSLQTILKIEKAGGKVQLAKPDYFQGKRLQIWLEPNKNWKGLIPELCVFTNDLNIHLLFRGRRIDYEDLVSYVDAFLKNNKGISVTLTGFEEVMSEADILASLDKIVYSFKDCPIEELHDKKLIDQYEKTVKNDVFEIGVIATMSCGKSTLVNSFLESNLLPMNNQACTARITRITDEKKEGEFSVSCKDDKGKMIYPKCIATAELLEQYNDNKLITYVDMVCNIPHISAKGMKLQLLDTPGPNNSGTNAHKELTETLIEDKNKQPIIMYVMNYTNLETTDDFTLLSHIADVMKTGGKQAKDRFIFVVNKFDQINYPKERTEEILEDVRQYLKKQGIEDPNLFPVSAYNAYLLRMQKRGDTSKLTMTEKRNLNLLADNFDIIENDDFHFEKFASLTSSVKNELTTSLQKILQKKASESDISDELIMYSGIPALEYTINEYLEKYAYPIKIRDAVDVYNKTLEETAMKLNFKNEIAKSEKNVEKAAIQIRLAKEALNSKNIQGIQKKFQNRLGNFSFDEQIIENTLTQADARIMEFRVEFATNHDKVEKSKADQMLKDFCQKANSYTKSFNDKLSSMVSKQVREKGNDLLEEYKKAIANIVSNLCIDNFDFTKTVGFHAQQAVSINEVMSNMSVETQEHYVAEQVKNPDRKWWQIYKPLKVEKVYLKSVTQYVNVEEVIEKNLGAVRLSIAKNVEAIKAAQQKEVENFHNFFNSELEKLTLYINDELTRLENDVQNCDNLRKHRDDLKYKYNWIIECQKRIQKTLEI